MFDTSIHGPLVEAAVEDTLKSTLTNVPGEPDQTLSDEQTTANPQRAEFPEVTITFGCEKPGEGIPLGDTGTITDDLTLPAPSTDNSDLPPSLVPIDNPGFCLDSPLISIPPGVPPGRFEMGTANAEKLAGGAGRDVIFGRGGDDFLRGGAGGDVMQGGSGADRIHGNSGQDFIRGNTGDDVIRAGVGDDFVQGGSGDDLINGGAGDDDLIGGAGDDTIIGRTGDDTLEGNGGADVFQFRASDRNDMILDFKQGQDRIEILNGADTFAELSIAQDGADVVIGFGTGQVTIISDDAGSFDASDFIF